ncbi:MAG: MaoC family dehydratase [Ilumatobacteraceae bacterium]
MIREGWLGRFYEDFEIGDVYRHALGRTISETDNTWFTLLTMNTNQMHFNAQYSSQSEFGKLLVNSTLTLAIVVGMSVSDISQNAVANLGWDDIKLLHPVFVGDTLWAESQVIDKRESKSRPDGGIVHVRTRGLNQNGDICITYFRTVLVHRKSARSLTQAFPEPVSNFDS